MPLLFLLFSHQSERDGPIFFMRHPVIIKSVIEFTCSFTRDVNGYTWKCAEGFITAGPSKRITSQEFNLTVGNDGPERRLTAIEDFTRNVVIQALRQCVNQSVIIE